MNISEYPPPLGFECLTLLKIEVIEYGKKGFKMACNAFSETPSHTVSPLTAWAARFKPSASSAPPPTNPSGSSPVKGEKLSLTGPMQKIASDLDPNYFMFENFEK